MYRILFVDDDHALLQAAKQYFKHKGDTLFLAKTGEEAMRLLQSVALDCLVLDIQLPDVDGFRICEQIRKTSGIPILILSNYTGFEERIHGLKLGADDYLCKPFSFDELYLRMEMRTQRRYIEKKDRLQYGNLLLNSEERCAYYKGSSCHFSELGYAILYLLASSPRQVFSYEQIYDAVWKEPLNASRHTLQARVAEVRVQLNTLCEGKAYIQTVRKKGYRFIPDPLCEHDDK